jgi:glycosyltransferase involved in cell wall biosynthesis
LEQKDQSPLSSFCARVLRKLITKGSSAATHCFTKPRILLLADTPNWAFDTAAQAFVKYLSDEFEFKVAYVGSSPPPDLAQWPFDLIYVFFWGETYHQEFVRDKNRVIKEVASHRWACEDNYGLLSPSQMVQTYLRDAGTVVTISKRLQTLLAPYREVFWAPNGFDPNRFFNLNQRQGDLKLGWAGRLSDPCKGVHDILVPAAGDDFDLSIAGGDMDYLGMAQFYNSIDVLCVASTAEGEPLPLLEAMACGCYPVCVDVGIVPELIQSGHNGLIIDRSVAAFRAAFEYCYMNVETIRKAGEKNAVMILKERQWQKTIGYWRDIFRDALQKQP